MPSVIYTSHSGEQCTIEARVGDSVMETAVRNGVDGIVGECGGSLSCATCHVFVDESDLALVPEITEMEDEMLWGTAVERADNSRLGCQLKLGEGITLHVKTPRTQI